MEYKEWELTDQERQRVLRSGGDIQIAQQAKRQAFIDNGGIILNPSALSDLYKACELVERAWVGDGVDMSGAVDACLLAIAKAKGKA